MAKIRDTSQLSLFRLLVLVTLLVIICPASNSKANKQSEKNNTDLSAAAIRQQLHARGVDLSSKTGSQSLNDALVEYDFQTGGGANLNSNAEEILKAIKTLNSSLERTALLSHVTVRTEHPGARIRYCLIGREDVQVFGQLTNHAADNLPIGLYFIWSERGGNATSSKTTYFRVIKKDEEIDIEEKQ